MANQQKQSYVSDLSEKIQNNPHLILVGFGGTQHKKLESFRGKLRAGEETPHMIVLKNSLFKIAFDRYNRKNQIISEEDSHKMQESAKGQLALMLTNGDWMNVLKAVKEFAKEDESVVFKAGLVDGVFYEESGLKKLADLPSKNELIAKLLGSIKAPQSRFVYGLQFNTTKLINVITNAANR